MKIIAGLGNPGPRYETTRHNVGFLAIDRMIDTWKANGPIHDHQGQIYQTSVAGEKVLLVKPETYMNNSGQCIAPLFKFYKCKPGDLIVIHDEIDLKPMALRIKTGGGTAGHNGLRSIDACLGAGNLNYHRIRIGVGKSSPEQPGKSPADHVLSPFTDRELGDLDPLLDRVVQATERMIRGDIGGAMTEFNKSPVDKNGNQE